MICNRRAILLGRSNQGIRAERGKKSHVRKNINAYIDLWKTGRTKSI